MTMQWVDVSGPPGVGKSTICDPLWGPHEIDFSDAEPPKEWHDFLNEVTRLMSLVRPHPSFVPAVRMNRRSIRKMAKVASMDPPHLRDEKLQWYAQTGFIQRGLGFAWRILDMGGPIEETYHFWRLMPTSRACVFLTANANTVKERNKDREKVKATAHENRSFMVDYMVEASKYAYEQIRQRGVPTLQYETDSTTPDRTRELLIRDCAKLSDPAPVRPGGEKSLFPGPLSKPVWF